MINGSISESSKCADSLLDFTDIVEDYTSETLEMVKEFASEVKNSSEVICLQNMVLFSRCILTWSNRTGKFI